ncbi:MAG TPA: hypothetical protein VJV23_02620 [Candidatus Polarisedimenticolia bacterium]|nr:hypothetical protein [Candidatus Polarisedimenticolia bacterium]
MRMGKGWVAAAALPLAAIVAAGRAAERPSGEDAARAFERFKALEGRWTGSNGRGEPVAITYEVMAGGTAIVEREEMSMNGRPYTMLTVYHLDGGDLLLTHYCMAGNQPRMRAEQVAGDEVRFEMRDATGMESPAEGHMRQAVFRFHGDGSFTSAWTFRKDGKDAFTEEATYRRAGGR